MSCAIPEFPLLPYEPVPRGETLAHWRNEIAKVWVDAREGSWCVETPTVDLSGIKSDIADLQQSMFDVEVLLPGSAATSTKIISANLELVAYDSVIISDYIEILTGVTVDLGEDATLETT